jgi:hypothetical protein
VGSGVTQVIFISVLDLGDKLYAPGRFAPRKGPQPLNSRLGEPQSRSGGFWREVSSPSR